MMENYSTIKKETLPFVTPWMEFEDITPKWSKLDRERDKYCMISCVDLRAKNKKSEFTSTEFRFKGLGVGKIDKGGKKYKLPATN